MGDKTPAFSLKNEDGRTVSLTHYQKEKGVVLIFTCNHCPYAKAYEERMMALHRQLAPKGFPVVAINPNDPQIVPEDSYENMQKRAREKKYPFVTFSTRRRRWPGLMARRRLRMCFS